MSHSNNTWHFFGPRSTAKVSRIIWMSTKRWSCYYQMERHGHVLQEYVSGNAYSAVKMNRVSGVRFLRFKYFLELWEALEAKSSDGWVLVIKENKESHIFANIDIFRTISPFSEWPGCRGWYLHVRMTKFSGKDLWLPVVGDMTLFHWRY